MIQNENGGWQGCHPVRRKIKWRRNANENPFVKFIGKSSPQNVYLNEKHVTTTETYLLFVLFSLTHEIALFNYAPSTHHFGSSRSYRIVDIS